VGRFRDRWQAADWVHRAALVAGTILAVAGFAWGMALTQAGRSIGAYPAVGWIVAVFALWLYSRLMPWE
jgi:hypothetical protein